MNSPPEPSSPTLSTPSTVSPSPEDVNFNPNAQSSTTSNLLNMVTSTLSPGSSKRRLPGSGSFGSGSSRDTKSRRREGAQRLMVGGSAAWDSKEPSKKEDMTDVQTVEMLRKEIGDPFDTAFPK
ncbi:hypothetical protein EDD85DRAFT_822030 [Armillaria nabsnona]|nr:hypothetical protein EDD85DRAFT_822030 [Armillaria nabsnona]